MAFAVYCPARGHGRRTSAAAAAAAAARAVGAPSRRGGRALPRWQRAVPQRGSTRSTALPRPWRQGVGGRSVVAVAADPPGHSNGGSLDARNDGDDGGGGGGGACVNDGGGSTPLPQRPMACITVRLGGVSLSLPGRVWLAAVPALWSTFIVSTKLLVSAPVALPPSLFNAARLCLSAAVCVPFIVREVRRGWKETGGVPAATAPGGGLDFLVPGVELGAWMFLANTAQMVGLRTTTASRAAFLVQLESVLVPLAAAALGVAPLTATAVVSSVVTVAGVAVLSSDRGGCARAAAAAAAVRGGGRVASLSVGDGLEVLAAMLLTAYVLRTSHHARRVRRAMPLVAVKIVTQAVLALGWAAVSRGIPVLLAAARTIATTRTAAVASRGWAVMPAGITPGVVALNVGLVVWSGLFVSATTTWLQTAGQRVVPASEAAIIYATQPLWASAFAAVVLGESFGWRGVLGGLLILVGVVLAGRRPPTMGASEKEGDGMGQGMAAPAPTVPTVAP